jgi:hypothetical protein
MPQFQIGDVVTLISWEGKDWDGIKHPGVIISIKPDLIVKYTKYEIYWFDGVKSQEFEDHIVKI